MGDRFIHKCSCVAQIYTLHKAEVDCTNAHRTMVLTLCMGAII